MMTGARRWLVSSLAIGHFCLVDETGDAPPTRSKTWFGEELVSAGRQGTRRCRAGHHEQYRSQHAPCLVAVVSSGRVSFHLCLLLSHNLQIAGVLSVQDVIWLKIDTHDRSTGKLHAAVSVWIVVLVVSWLGYS